MAGRVFVFDTPPQLLTLKRAAGTTMSTGCVAKAVERPTTKWLYILSLTEPEWCLFIEQKMIVIVFYFVVCICFFKTVE